MQKCMGGMFRWRIDGETGLVHAGDMRRREWLGAVGTIATGGMLGCAAVSPSTTSTPRKPGKIRGICFDLFTLFDPRSLIERVREHVSEGAEALCDAWRTKQFEYAFLRVAGGNYVDFRQVTSDALVLALSKQKVELSPAAREKLVGAYAELTPWPDTQRALEEWKRRGLRLAPLANYSPSMIDGLLAHAGLGKFFDERISTDRARTFKPDPRAYALGPAALGVPKEELVFAAFGGWDAAGAKWFGFPTFWVNRLGQPAEQLPPGPDAQGPDLSALAAFIDSR
jgi:2-haloacid dehalogenase